MRIGFNDFNLINVAADSYRSKNVYSMLKLINPYMSAT